jgi:hypothetical protein
MPEPKRGNPCRSPRKCRRSLPTTQPLKRARLTLHDSDPITGSEDTFYTLFYEFYRGYTIYSAAQGRCCIHGKHGCIKLRGQFVCFPDVEEAKTLINAFVQMGTPPIDSVERYLPEWEYVCLNRYEQQSAPLTTRPIQRVS